MRMVPLRGMKVLSRRPSARRAAALVVLGVLLGSGAHWVSAASAESGPAGDSWDWEAYERQREAAHARLEASGEDTMYASTPSPPAHPVHLPAPHQYVGATQESIQRVPSAFELAAASAAASGAEGGAFHAVPFLPTASDAARQGVVRVINHANESGAAEIHAVDDAGRRVGPLRLTLAGGAAVQFNSADLEQGNVDKGLATGAGSGTGAWRLAFASDLDIEVLAYVRTTDGLLVPMHDVVAQRDGEHRVATFNPGDDGGPEGKLRLLNTGDRAAEVTITGVDDAGDSPGTDVRLSIPSGAARTLTAAELESGAPDLEGALGDGEGHWRLAIESTGDIDVVNLLEVPGGHMANLSTAPDLRDDAGTWMVPLVPPANDPASRQGLVRVINRGDVAGTVRIDAADGSDRDYEPITLNLGAGEAVNLNSDDLEQGNALKGLAGGLGAGEGDWRLALESELDIEVLAYVRTPDGLLMAMHDSAPLRDAAYLVPLFNPASNRQQASSLRIVNRGSDAAALTVTGIDDRGRSPGSKVRFSVPAGGTRTVTAQQLESGEGVEGALGDGAGKWRLAVASDHPVIVMGLLASPTGHLANVSTAGARHEAQTAEQVFSEFIAGPIVQAKCANCHVENGLSGHTRLVFEKGDGADQERANLRVFANFVATVEDGATRILNKIRGVSHGGGIQVPSGSAEFEKMRLFLQLLGEDVDAGGPPITASSLFEGVRMESARRTLYRAAVLFAGRIPTPEELAPFPGGTPRQLWDTIRGMMTGPEFHEFLTRGANDRLLTASLRQESILDDGHRGVISNGDYARFLEYEAELERLKGTGPNERGQYPSEWWVWQSHVDYGAAQAPVELIAYVVENDLPYTKILTANYVMANAATAKAYSATATFDDPDDPYEFRPVRIQGYRRPGVTMDNYPHAGILSTTAFLRRYPTTPTNRNRARSRWTYHHFLGEDIQNSAPARTAADALLDTRNPTMHNPACTVCHIPLDPVAGAFQNYTETGFYRATLRGKHAFWPVYIHPESYAQRHHVPISTKPIEIVQHAVPITIDSEIVLRHRSPRSVASSARLWMDEISLQDHDTGTPYPLDIRLAERCCPHNRHTDVLLTHPNTGKPALWFQPGGTRYVPVNVPDGRYDIIAQVWAEGTEGQTGLAATAKLYQDGDTWYRDMRQPGFQGDRAPNADASLPWLAKRMAADPRFGEGAVKFWWPAIMGKEVSRPPAEGDSDFDGRLLGATAQAAEVARLATGFKRGFRAIYRPYNLKDLLVAMVLSPWFRAERDISGGRDAVRTVALRAAGARRLLTPEELTRKTGAITGFQWGRYRMFIVSSCCLLGETKTSLTNRFGFNLLYGGIDSETKLARTRDINDVMAAVAKVHAIQSSCPIVLREFYLLPNDRRRLFAGIGPDTGPETTAGEEAIRSKLAELHYKLLGIDVGPSSVEVNTAYSLFLETLERRRQGNEGARFRDGNVCDTRSDVLILQDVVDPPDFDPGGEHGRRSEQNDPDGLLTKAYDDEHYLARTWVVVLAYLMMDYRYLYL